MTSGAVNEADEMIDRLAHKSKTMAVAVIPEASATNNLVPERLSD
jgi:hypothetical protein